VQMRRGNGRLRASKPGPAVQAAGGNVKTTRYINRKRGRREDRIYGRKLIKGTEDSRRLWRRQNTKKKERSKGERRHEDLPLARGGAKLTWRKKWAS